MERSLAIAAIGFAIVLVGAGAAMLHPLQDALFMPPTPHNAAFLTAALTFVVTAVLEHDR